MRDWTFYDDFVSKQDELKRTIEKLEAPINTLRNVYETNQRVIDSLREEYENDESRGVLPTMINYLAMYDRPSMVNLVVENGAYRFTTVEGVTFTIREVVPSVQELRVAYNRVGRRWKWYQRNLEPDFELYDYIRNPKVTILSLTTANHNTPCGFAEIDIRSATGNVAELAYFGLYPEMIGRGIGQPFLNKVVDIAWSIHKDIDQIIVNTNNHDHPAALRNYIRAGFQLINRECVGLANPDVLWPERVKLYDLESYPWPKTALYNRLLEKKRIIG